MPQIDFYLMAAGDARARLLTVCRLVEKAYEQGLQVAVRTTSTAETVELDELLWTYADRSFIPHATWPTEPELAALTPVLISHTAMPDSHNDVLINLAHDAPADFSRYSRVCEVVGSSEESRGRARQRWRGYRDAGCEPAKHDIN
jgi:DNA polymerase-3 subunit chi